MQIAPAGLQTKSRKVSGWLSDVKKKKKKKPRTCLNAKSPEGACHGTLQKLRTANTIQKDHYDSAQFHTEDFSV